MYIDFGEQDSQVHRFLETGILKYIDFWKPWVSSTSIFGHRESQVHRFWGTGVVKYIDFWKPAVPGTSILGNEGYQLHLVLGGTGNPFQ